MSELKKRKFTVAEDRFMPSEYFRNGDWHWSYTVILFGIFIGFFTLFYVGKVTLIEWESLLKIYLFLALLPLLVPYKFHRTWFKIERLEMVLFHVLGMGPLVLSVLLWANYMFHTNTQELNVPIEQVKSVGSGISPGDVELVFSDGTFAEYPGLRIYDHIEVGPDIFDAESAHYSVSRGILGYDVVTAFSFK